MNGRALMQISLMRGHRKSLASALSNLSSFDGEAPNGNWTLTVIDDDAAGSNGFLQTGKLFLNTGLPNASFTFVGEVGDELSGGQKQRLSIARALMNNKPILILDDSLSAVDGTTEKEIIGNIKETRKGKTNIIISHRFSVIKEADKIIVLQNGEVQEVGTHKELMKSRKWYYEQYNNQVRG